MRSRLLLVGLASLCLTGCPFEFKFSSPDIVKSTENLASATKGIDPLGLKKLLDENATLKEQLGQVSALYQESMGSGALVVSQQAIYWRVTDYTGGLRVVVSIDEQPKGIVVSESEFTTRSIPLGFDANWFLFQKKNPPELIGLGYSKQIDVRLQEYADNLYYKAARAQPVPSSAAPKEVWLNPRFPTTGLHNIVVSVTPRALAADKWHLVWELISRDADGKNEKVLASFNMNSSTCGPDLNKTCTKMAPVLVKLTGS